MANRTTISISKKFKEYLDSEIAYKSETYEDILKKLLKGGKHE